MPNSPNNSQPLFPDADSLTLHVFPWMETPMGRFLGKGRVELLEKIIEQGSISKAAKEMGMTYKKAWDLINSMNTQSVKPLVVTQTGGGGGGGAVVTDVGRLAISLYKDMKQRLEVFLKEENERLRAAMLGGME